MSPRARRISAPAPWRASLLAGALVAACAYPQRLPGPLVVPGQQEVAPEPAPADPGSFRATVQRDSAPVWVRRPGQRDDYALPYHRKRERLPPGAMVRSGEGGRAELHWSPDATSVVLFDEGRVTLGDPERDEPLVRFHSVTHAVLVLTPEDRIELPGGALLQGDQSEVFSSILLARDPNGCVRVTNQSKFMAHLRFREETLELGPGESIDLPDLAAGSGPREAFEPERAETAGIALAWRGALQHSEDGLGVRVRAEGPAWVRAQGVTAALEDQQEAHFSGLSQVPTAVPADVGASPGTPR